MARDLDQSRIVDDINPALDARETRPLSPAPLRQCVRSLREVAIR
jgi:hypothetical protein